MTNGIFHSPSKSDVELDELIDLIKAFVESDQDAQYKLTIGSDSEIKHLADRGTVLNVITAVVIHKKGRGGKYFWKKKVVENVKTLRNKIYHEVFSSLDTAKELVPKLKTKILNTSYDLEIHVDVGEKGETKDMINEVVGVITGNGFIARTKPESYAASSVADKYA